MPSPRRLGPTGARLFKPSAPPQPIFPPPTCNSSLLHSLHSEAPIHNPPSSRCHFSTRLAVPTAGFEATTAADYASSVSATTFAPFHPLSDASPPTPLLMLQEPSPSTTAHRSLTAAMKCCRATAPPLLPVTLPLR
jgi:hypothetical protein